MTVVVQHPEYHGDAWDRLAKAVNIGTSIYGLKLETDKYELNKRMQEAEEGRKVRTEEIQNRMREGNYKAGELPMVLKETGSSFSRQLPDKPNLSHLGIPYKAGKRDDYIKSKLGEEQIYITKDAPIVKPNKSTSINVGAKQQKPTEYQSKSALYGAEMENANKLFEIVENEYKGFDPAKLKDGMKNGKFYPELIKDEAAKIYGQAIQMWVNAINRRDSGATITEYEVWEQTGMVGVKIGDTERVKEIKRKRRLAQIEATFSVSGPAGGGLRDQNKKLFNVELKKDSSVKNQPNAPWVKKW